MIELEQLRYVRLVADNLGGAADFAQRVLGLEPIDRNPELATFRSDFRDYTLAFATGSRAVQSVGLEVRHSHDLDAALAGLRRLGLSANRGSTEDCTLRRVKDLLWFTDFSGNYSKALLHDSLGVPNANAFRSLTHALQTGEQPDFASIIVGTPGGERAGLTSRSPPACIHSGDDHDHSHREARQQGQAAVLPVPHRLPVRSA